MKKLLLYFAGNINDPKGTPNRVRTISEILNKIGFEIYFAGKVKPIFVDEQHFFQLPHPAKRLFLLFTMIRKHGIEAVYFQTSAHITLLALLSRLVSVPCGCDFHSLLHEEEFYYGKISRIGYQIRKFIDRVVATQLDFATGVCGSLKAYYAQAIPHFEILSAVADQVFFDPAGVSAQEVIAWKDGKILVGYAGNSKDYQGVDVLIRAMQIVEERRPNVFKVLLVVSSGFDEVRRNIDSMYLTNSVLLLGQQSHDAMPELLRACDILTIPRRDAAITRFAFPSKIAEYAALGKPLLVTDVGDLSLFINDGVNGFVVPPENHERLAHALLQMEDARVRVVMGDAIRTTAINNFHPDAFKKKLNKLFNSLSK